MVSLKSTITKNGIEYILINPERDIPIETLCEKYGKNTADLMTGNNEILQFLLTCGSSEKGLFQYGVTTVFESRLNYFVSLLISIVVPQCYMFNA